MAIRAPTGRKPLSADALCGLLRTGFAAIADHRPGTPDMSLTDALMAALALCSLTSPSLLAFDKERTAGNVQRVFGLERVPCDTAMREILAPVDPESRRPLCQHVFRALQRGKALAERVVVQGHDLLARAGTGYFSSQQLHGASCCDMPHRNGPGTYRHQRWGAALMHPDQRAVLPLRPEPSEQHDGTSTHDGARHAAKRWIGKRRQDHPHRPLIVTEERRSAHAPPIKGLQEDNRQDILGVKAGAQAFVFQQVAAAEQAGRVTSYAREDPETGMHQHVRFVSAVPLHASNADLRGNVLECWETVKSQGQPCSWVTDLCVTQGTGSQLMRGGRARWRIEKATCHTLQNHGEHCEHHSGHGEQHRSVVCAVRMLWAFVVDQVQQLCCPLFHAVWAKLGSNRRRWERRRALCEDDALDAMRHLCEALWYGWKKTAPLFAVDSASSPVIFLGAPVQSHATTPGRRRHIAPCA